MSNYDPYAGARSLCPNRRAEIRNEVRQKLDAMGYDVDSMSASQANSTYHYQEALESAQANSVPHYPAVNLSYVDTPVIPKDEPEELPEPRAAPRLPEARVDEMEWIYVSPKVAVGRRRT